MLRELIFLTNMTLDPDNWDEVRRLGLPMGLADDGHGEPDPDYPLTDAELALLGEGGYPIMGVQHADLQLGHSVLYQGKKCACPSIEFHFRNDATRHLWGNPPTFEVDMPSREFQVGQVRAVLRKARTCIPLCGDVGVVYDDLETKDRHTMYLTIPFVWLGKAEIKNYEQHLAFMRGLLFLDT
jgi:hypothetical protein